ncbi:MAG: GIY-YIG nuclease family protein [Actinomycetota bacterium]|nr:GIY-YIG nuclease family protein [Actinomycetota bacterium]MDA8278747.1 GIY-YIG nuclease family protein [Actinomycetota bacterium]
MPASLAESVRQPKIYAYTTCQFAETPWVGERPGKGLLKVGYTDQDANVRVRQQLQGVQMPVAVEYELLLTETAISDNGVAFRDHNVHRALVAAGVHRVTGEWFECTVEDVRAAVQSIKSATPLTNLRVISTFPMRPEQEAAVSQTADYFKRHRSTENPPHFLWNAKMRFGKTFTTYQLAKHMGWSRILVLTYKPAVEKNWREDLLGHRDFQGWRFNGKADEQPDLSDRSPLVWFASFQDVLGKNADGNTKVKNEILYRERWDVVVIDEYHFGAWREAARSLYLKDDDDGGDVSEKKALDNPDLDDDFSINIEEGLDINVDNYLYLSGTPFRALTQGEFLEDQVFNWTYSDEQRAKNEWKQPPSNPYKSLPRMTLLTYEMPDKLREIALNNQSMFSFTEFFRTSKDIGAVPKFIHENEVQKWLSLLTGQNITDFWSASSTRQRPPLPYEDTNLLQALQHTVWYLPSVDACTAMANLLGASHNTFFRQYKTVVAAGSGAGLGEEALPPVLRAIGPVPQDTKTITLTCGKLMTGVTVPPWTGIFMLRELKSPESYFQAAFRVQSPWVSRFVDTAAGGEDEIVLKEQCFVFDFAPNRALQQVVDYATRLRADDPSERDDQKAVDEFMAFLPVLAYDGHSMRQLNAEDVIDYLTHGISASMLARRWNSPELIELNARTMEALLENPKLLASLEQMELFREINLKADLEAMIATNKELRQKSLAKEQLSAEEKATKKDATKKRDNIKKRLQRFLTRIPAFMYLTDDRERTVHDIIRQIEPDLFEKVTGLTLSDFAELVDLRVFNDSKMNDAVWKFRTFEEPSLRYGENLAAPEIQGGWNLRRDPRFTRLIETGLLAPGSRLLGTIETGIVEATVGEDFGILIDGIRYESPNDAAEAAARMAPIDGWSFWKPDEYNGATLAEVSSLLD